MSCCCFACVETGSVGVVQRCGEFTGLIEPGFSIVLPYDMVRPISMAVQQMECRSDCKTKDNVTLSVETAIQYKIQREKIETAVFQVVDPQGQIRAHVDDVLRSTLPTMELDEAYGAKTSMVASILDSVKEAMSPYGFEILNVLITDLRPESSVLKAMNEINASRRMREAALEKGEADKILLVKASEAEAEAKYLSGVGVARMRAAITDGFKTSVATMADCGLDSRDAVHMMLVTQYLDTLKEFANGKSSIMVPHGPGAIKDIEAQVRDGFVTAQSMGNRS